MAYTFTPSTIGGTGSYNTEDWTSLLGGMASGGLTGAASAAGINEQVARLRALGGAASTDYGNLAQQAVQGVEFTPYTLTNAGLGSVSQTAPGVITQTLTPQQQANVDAAALMQGNLYGAALPDTSGIQKTAFGNVGGYISPTDNAQLTGLSTLFGAQAANQLVGYGAPTGLEGTTAQALQGAATGLSQLGNTQDMAQQLYEGQLGLMSPTQQRQQLELENRLRAQGRLGTQTAAYGGTPEQLALMKAQEEQKQQAAYNALTGAEGMLSSQQARALGLLQAGQQGTTLQDQLLSSQQNRATQSAQATSAMAAANQALQQGDVQTAASLFNIGQAAAQLPQSMQGQNIAQAGQLQAQAFTPAQQQLNQLAAASNLGQQAAGTAYQAGSLFSNIAGAGLQERLTAESAAAALRGKEYASALDALARSSGTTGSNTAVQAVNNISDTINAIKTSYNALSQAFSGVDFTKSDWMTQYGLDATDQAIIDSWTTYDNLGVG